MHPKKIKSKEVMLTVKKLSLHSKQCGLLQVSKPFVTVNKKWVIKDIITRHALEKQRCDLYVFTEDLY
jgi:hypothetical protein